MTKSEEGKRVKPKTVGLSVLTVAMVVILLMAVGNQLRYPWPLSVQLNYPTDIYVASGRAAVIDQQYSRLTLINPEKQAAAVFDVNPNGSNGEQFSATAVDENAYYYSVAKGYADSTYLASEKVYRQTIAGEETLLYERSYDASQKISQPAFLGITPLSDGSDVLLLSVDPTGKNVEVVSLVASPGKVERTAGIPDEIGTLKSLTQQEGTDNIASVSRQGSLVLTVSGGLEKFEFDGFTYVTDVLWASDGLLYCVDGVSGALLCIDPQTKSVLRTIEGNFSCVQREYLGSVICGTDTGIVSVDIESIKSGGQPEVTTIINETVPYSLGLSAWTILVWVAMVYLFVLIVFVLIHLVKSMRAEGKDAVISRVGTICVSIIAVVAVSLFISGQFYNSMVQNRLSSIGAACQEGAKSLEVAYANENESWDADGPTTDQLKRMIGTAGEKFVTMCQSQAEFNSTMTVIGTFETGDKVTSVVADVNGYSVQRFTMTGEEIDAAKTMELADSATEIALCSRETYAASQYLTAIRSITDDSGNIIGCMKVYGEITDLDEEYRSLCIEMIMTLMAVAGALVLIFIEGKALIESIGLRREERSKPAGKPEIWSTRQLGFWISMATCFDSTMLILVAKELLAVEGLTNVDVLAGLPATLSALGMFAGSIIFGILGSKVSGKKLTIVGLVGAGAFFILSALAISLNSFWAFCIFRGGVNFMASLALGLTSALPLQSNDEKVRGKLFQDFSLSAISGMAIGGIICGYVSQYLGNSAIYIACVVPTAIALLMTFRCLPGKKIFMEKASESTSGKKGGTLRLFLTPAVLALVICIVIPSMLANGYKSVLFPLFMSEGGMSNTYINNIVVITNVIVFAISPAVSKAFDNLDQWHVVIIALLMSAVSLIWFMVNSTMVWAIIALIFLGLGYRICSPGSKILLPREARVQGVSETSANNSLTVVTNFAASLPSTVLSALSVFGQSLACCIVGLICGVGAALFGLVSKNSSLAHGDDTSAGQTEGTDAFAGDAS